MDRTFRKDVAALVIPLVGNSFSLVNTLMVGRLGDAAIAVVAAAGQVGFMLSMILSGVYGMNAFITQYDGGRDQASVRKAFGLMLLSGTAVTLTLVAAAFLFRKPLLLAFVHDPDAAAYGMPYLTVLLAVYAVNAVKDAYGGALGAIGRAKLTLVVGFAAMAVNVALDYALIYGHFGFEPLGIVGAAWSTLVSSIVGAAAFVGWVYARKLPFNVSPREILAVDFAFAKRVYAKTLPLVFHEGLWSLGNMLYAAAFGYMGVSALAAFQLARTFNGYFMMGVFGFAYAANVMIGRKLGQENAGEAIRYARTFTKWTVLIALAVGAASAAASPWIVRLFGRASAEVRTDFEHILFIQSGVMLAYFLNNLWIVGLFRAGGDNAYTMKLILVTTWLIALPLVFAGACLLHWPVELVYIMFALEEVSKACIGYFRYRSNRWANSLVRPGLSS
nr:MATE family efflux transporter [Paenibacillus artemisiicola]